MDDQSPERDPNVKGNIAEQAIVLAAMKAGVRVLAPVGEHGRIDLAFDVADRLWRVRVKWGLWDRQRGVVSVRLGPRGSLPVVTSDAATHRARSTCSASTAGS